MFGKIFTRLHPEILASDFGHEHDTRVITNDWIPRLRCNGSLVVRGSRKKSHLFDDPAFHKAPGISIFGHFTNGSVPSGLCTVKWSFRDHVEADLVTRDPACGDGIYSIEYMSSMTQSYFNQMFEFLGRLLH